MEVGGESEESHLMRKHIPDNLRVLPSPDLHEGSEVEGGGEPVLGIVNIM